MNPNPDPNFDRQAPEPVPTETEHARLCAYLLGELPAVQRDRLESKLNADPALAAVAAQIQATLDLVSAAFPDIADAPEEYELSAGRRAALLAAAKDSRPSTPTPSWWPSIAAAVIAIAAAGLYRGYGTAGEPTLESDVLSAAHFEHQRVTRTRDAVESSKTQDDGRLQQTPDREERADGIARDVVFGLPAELSVDATTSGEPTIDPVTAWSRAPDEHGTRTVEPVGGVVPAAEAGLLGLGTFAAKPEQLENANHLLLLKKEPAAIDLVGFAATVTPNTQDGLAAFIATSTLSAEAYRSLQTAVAREGSQTLMFAPVAGGGSLERGVHAALPPITTSGVVYETRIFDIEVANGAKTADLPSLTINPEALIQHCRRQPNETPAMMFFRFWGDNPFVRTARDPISTFSADVDTASYALARRYLNSGLIPEKAAIRTEEFVNYFRADVQPPEQGTFRVQLEGAKSLFGGTANDRYLLRVTLRGRDAGAADRANHRLTFVVDTSGSMKEQNRMELVKHGLRLLVGQMTDQDQISIVAFNSNAQLILPMTSVRHRGVIEAAIHGLTPDGSTNAEAGLKLGYEVAATSLDAAATSRVILLSDGVANVGQTDQDRINGDVKNRREQGIYLNTIGVGLGNHNDVFLEQLADQGDGLCNYIDSEKEAQRALVENFTGALVTIARDVKIQVEFDPAVIGSYRQLGYENRAVADHDFRNDHVDAGEVGAGHQVTALYEVEPLVDLRTAGASLGTVRIRYKPPFGGTRKDGATAPTEDGMEVSTATAAEAATEIEATWTADHLSLDYAQASSGYRRATLAAEFAELLRRSIHARDGSLDLLYHEATLLDAELKDPDFSEFCDLVKASRQIVAARPVADDPLSQAIDAVRRNAVLRAELEDLAHDRDARLLEQIERENQRLEDRIRELLRGRTDREDRR